MKKSELTLESVKALGFKEMPHFTIMNSLVLNVGRNRQLSLGNLETPNEMLFLSEVDDENKPTKILDTIVLSNYDYDGYLTIDNLRLILSIFNIKQNETNRKM